MSVCQRPLGLRDKGIGAVVRHWLPRHALLLQEDIGKPPTRRPAAEGPLGDDESAGVGNVGVGRERFIGHEARIGDDGELELPMPMDVFEIA